jgi:hypothetical protein
MSAVQKLDDPEKFAEIKTGLKTSAALKPHELERLSVWYNYFKSRDELVPANKQQIGWVADHWQTIEKYIKDTYSSEKGYSGNTLRNHLEGLANILLAIDKNRFKEIVRPFFNLGLSIQQRIDKVSEESKLSKKDLQNFVPFEDLVKKREELATLWAADPKNLKLNMFHLILAVNTMIPPLRLDFTNMSIYPSRIVDGRSVRASPTSTEPPNDTNNYLWEYSPGKWAIVINSDKIENKRLKRGLSRQIMKLDDEIDNVTDGRKLNTIINESLTADPRNYVLIGFKNKESMPASTYNSSLAQMFAPKKPTQNVLRKSYVNYWHSKNLSTGNLKQIADRMRHTLFVAMESYRKINLNEAKVPEIPAPVVTAPRPPAPVVIAPRPPAPAMVGPRPPALPRPPAGSPPTLPVVLPIQPSRELPVIPIIATAPRAPVLPPKVYFSPAAYAREYRESHKAEIARKRVDRYDANKHRILRDKILNQLNRGQVKRPTQRSIETYALKQSEDSGRWYTLQGE